MKVSALGRAVVALLVMEVGAALAAGAADDQAKGQEARPTPVRTAKERLSGKAADQQRVNDCKVPIELRGPKVRPDDCGPGTERAPER